MIGPGTLWAPSYSVMLPPYFAVTPTAFATSIGEPPPNATIKSAPVSLNAAVALSTVSTDGFPSISVNISTAIPADFKEFAAFSTSPIFARCGPDIRNAWEPPDFLATSGSFARLPFPTVIFCGTEKLNSFIIKLCLQSNHFSASVHDQLLHRSLYQALLHLPPASELLHPHQR